MTDGEKLTFRQALALAIDDPMYVPPWEHDHEPSPGERLRKDWTPWDEAAIVDHDAPPEVEIATAIESEASAREFVLRFEPHAASVLDLDGLRLLPNVAGTSAPPTDLTAQIDIYCTKFGSRQTELWFHCLDHVQNDLCVIDLSRDSNTDAKPAVMVDANAKTIRVDVDAFPSNEWRLFYVGQKELHRSARGRRVVFAMMKDNDTSVESRLPACELILKGRLIDALTATRQEALDFRQVIIRRWVLLSRMQHMIDREAKPSLKKKLAGSGYEFLLADLDELVEHTLDSLKQSLIEIFPN